MARICTNKLLCSVTKIHQFRFYQPQDIFVDKNGTIYTVDAGNHQIGKWTIRGGITRIKISNFFKNTGTLNNEFVLDSKKFATDDEIRPTLFRPYSITVSTDGDIFVADAYRRIVKFDSLGNFIVEFALDERTESITSKV